MMQPNTAGHRIGASRQVNAERAGNEPVAETDTATAGDSSPVGTAERHATTAVRPAVGACVRSGESAQQISIDPLRATDRYRLAHPIRDSI